MEDKEIDLKRIRKLRKYLRQAEHLTLLTRDLNDDEKQKVFFRFLLTQYFRDSKIWRFKFKNKRSQGETCCEANC
jgi:hypothetical protein